MKIHMLTIFCALCTYHWQPSGSTRPKRTINMFENLIKSMRLVLNTPTESSIKYVSPPVRIRSNTPPKRIIYIKRYPMPNAKRVKPYPRRLSNKNTIPHHMKLPIQNPKQPVPWSLNPLPPPVPTSKATDPADDPPIPWNLHALPPPMATKRSKIDRPPAKKKTRTKKKLAEQQSSKEEPKQRKEKQSKTSSQFVSSPLQSEISVQPAIEIASYSETLSSQETNVVPNKPIGLHRIPRDLSHANRPNSNYSKIVAEKSSDNTPSKLTTSSTSWSVSQKGGIQRHFNDTTETPQARNLLPMVDEYPSTEPMPFSSANSPMPALQSDFLTGLDFGEYSDNVEADKELVSAASGPQIIVGAHPSTSVSIVKSPDVLNYHEMSPSYQPQLVEITPKPFCVTGYPHTAHMQQETKIQEKYDGEKQSTNNADTFENKPFSYRDELFPTNQPFKFGGESRSFNKPKNSVLDPNFGRTRSRINPNRWSNSKSKVSFSNRNNDGNQWNPGSLFVDNMRSFGGNDKIEFFEPIVIDIEKDNDKTFNFESAFNFKRKTKTKQLFNEPLKLPDSLHETMNFLQKSVMRSPPPIFDIE